MTSLMMYKGGIEQLIDIYQSGRRGVGDFNEVHERVLKALDDECAVAEPLDYTLLQRFRQTIPDLRRHQASLRLEVRVAESMKRQRVQAHQTPSRAQALVENAGTLAARRRKRSFDELLGPFEALRRAVTTKLGEIGDDLLTDCGSDYDDPVVLHRLTEKSYRLELLKKLSNSVNDAFSL